MSQPEGGGGGANYCKTLNVGAGGEIKLIERGKLIIEMRW